MDISIKEREGCLRNGNPLFCLKKYNLKTSETIYINIANNDNFYYYDLISSLQAGKNEQALSILKVGRNSFDSTEMKYKIESLNIGKYVKEDIDQFFRHYQILLNEKQLIDNIYEIFYGACIVGNEPMIRYIMENHDIKILANEQFDPLYEMILNRCSDETILFYFNNFSNLLDYRSFDLLIKLERFSLLKLLIEINLENVDDTELFYKYNHFYDRASALSSIEMMDYLSGKMKEKNINREQLDTIFLDESDYPAGIYLPISLAEMELEYSRFYPEVAKNILTNVYQIYLLYYADRNYYDIVKYILNHFQFKDLFDLIYEQAIRYYFPIEINNLILNWLFYQYLLDNNKEKYEKIVNYGIWNYDGNRWYNKVIHDNDDYIIKYLKKNKRFDILDWISSFEFSKQFGSIEIVI